METSDVFSPVERLLRDSLNDIVIEKHHNIVSIKAVFALDDSLPFFAGHFPAQPVFPAVLQVAIVRLLSSEAVKLTLQNDSLGKTKFSNIIRPKERIIVDIDLCLKDIVYEAKFVFYNVGKVASSGTINYKIAG